MYKFLVKLSFLICLLSSFKLPAREPYSVALRVANQKATVTAPNLVDLKRDLRTSAIEQLLPVYTPVSPTSLNFNLRGIFALGAFPANSTTLIVNIPQTGETASFTGATRDDSITLFREFVRDGGTHTRLLRAYARYSPIDPIAGNPNSLMAQMGQYDYALAHLSPLDGCNCCCWSAQPIVNQVQIGIGGGRTFAGGYDTTVISLPLRYSYSPDLNHAFIIDAPLSYLRNGGASSLVGSLGIGFRLPVTCNWSVTPVARLGSGGTIDLCTAGAFAAIGATSNYNVKWGSSFFSLTNYASYISSVNLWIGGVNLNYHLHNYIFKNGLSFTTCNGYCLWGKEINGSISFADSYFAREKLYIRHFDEVGASLIVNDVLPYFCYDSLTLNFTYRFGQHSYKGYIGNVIYQF